MPKKILLIEDEEALLDMYQLRFEKEGYNILLANQGQQGIKLAKKEQPDLILLDVVMPEMDGYEVLKKLKADPKTKNLKVVFLSNLGQDEEVKQGLELGAEDYIIKSSLTPSSLVKKIGEKLGKATAGKKISNSRSVPDGVIGQQSCKGFKVLLIEDNEVIIDMYKLRLEKEGAKVEVAKNGAWGLKLARSKKFDIILMDMIMPALNGLEAIKTLQENSQTAKIPIIVFSNSAQQKEMEAAKKAGAKKYFIKSEITPATLVREIKKYCQ